MKYVLINHPVINTYTYVSNFKEKNIASRNYELEERDAEQTYFTVTTPKKIVASRRAVNGTANHVSLSIHIKTSSVSKVARDSIT